MKTVTFKGEQYKVPDMAKYIAQDSDGELHWFTHEPYLIECVNSKFYSNRSIKGASWGFVAAIPLIPNVVEIK